MRGRSRGRPSSFGRTLSYFNQESTIDLQPNSEMLPISAVENLLAQFLDFSGDPNGLELAKEKNAKSKVTPEPSEIKFEKEKMKEEKWNIPTIQEPKPPVEQKKAPIPEKKIENNFKPKLAIDEKSSN